MIKKLLAFSLLCVMSVTLTGCDGLFAAPNEVLNAPKLTGELEGLENAIENTIKDKYDFAYPSSGEYRTSCIQVDLDGNEINEVLVFYIPKTDGLLHFNLFVKNGSDWKSVGDVSLESASVEKVLFKNLCGDGKLEIVIGTVGFSVADLRTRKAFVYSYDGEKIQPKFQENCTDFALCNLIDDGYSQLMMLNVSVNQPTVDGAVAETQPIIRTAVARLISVADGSQNVRYCGEAQMEPSAVSIASSVQGKIDGKPTLFVDSNVGTNQISTSAFVFDNEKSKLTNPLYDVTTHKTTLSTRPIGLLCQDVDADGNIEIPFSHSQESELTDVMVSWGRFQNGEMTVCKSGFYNTVYSYYFDIPSKWTDVIVTSENNDETKIYSVSPSAEMNGGVKLCTVEIKDKKSQTGNGKTAICSTENYDFYLELASMPAEYSIGTEIIASSFRVL